TIHDYCFLIFRCFVCLGLGSTVITHLFQTVTDPVTVSVPLPRVFYSLALIHRNYSVLIRLLPSSLVSITVKNHCRDPSLKGQVKQKKKLGGAPPGNRRVAQPTYQPADNEYHQIDSTTAVATAHFVTCPGGNALILVGKPNRAEEQAASSGKKAKYIQVTLPSGINPGDVIHVKAPDGRINAIIVPEGMGPGSTFTVEFADDTPSPAKEEDLAPGVFVPTVIAEPEVETGVPTSSGGTNAGGNVIASATDGPYVPAVYATPETNFKT
ncbi:hypothetical protein ACHAXS_013527, partial [Conticribra weissflogii]